MFKTFTPEDFVYGGGVPLAPRCLLKKTAIPSIFPWNMSPKPQRTTRLSQNAAGQAKQHEKSHTQGATDTELSDYEYDGELDTIISDSSSDSTEQLHTKVIDLTGQLTTLQSKLEKSILFRLENIKKDDNLISFYTGFPNYDTLITFYRTILKHDAKVMRQWRSGESKDSYAEIKIGRSFKLPLLDNGGALPWTFRAGPCC